MGRVFKYIGIVAVSFIALLAAMMGYAAFKQVSTAEANGKTAVAALRILSSDWQASGKGDVVHPSLVSAAATPQGRAGIAAMARLGELISAGETSQTGFQFNAGGADIATIEFPATFANGTADVIITLATHDSAMKLVKVDMKNMKPVRPGSQET